MRTALPERMSGRLMSAPQTRRAVTKRPRIALPTPSRAGMRRRSFPQRPPRRAWKSSPPSEAPPKWGAACPTSRRGSPRACGRGPPGGAEALWRRAAKAGKLQGDDIAAAEVGTKRIPEDRGFGDTMNEHGGHRDLSWQMTRGPWWQATRTRTTSVVPSRRHPLRREVGEGAKSPQRPETQPLRYIIEVGPATRGRAWSTYTSFATARPERPSDDWKDTPVGIWSRRPWRYVACDAIGLDTVGRDWM